MHLSHVQCECYKPACSINNPDHYKLVSLEWLQSWRYIFKAEEVCACFLNYTVNTTAITLKPDDLPELK